MILKALIIFFLALGVFGSVCAIAANDAAKPEAAPESTKSKTLEELILAEETKGNFKEAETFAAQLVTRSALTKCDDAHYRAACLYKLGYIQEENKQDAAGSYKQAIELWNPLEGKPDPSLPYKGTAVPATLAFALMRKLDTQTVAEMGKQAWFYSPGKFPGPNEFHTIDLRPLIIDFRGLGSSAGFDMKSDAVYLDVLRECMQRIDKKSAQSFSWSKRFYETPAFSSDKLSPKKLQSTALPGTKLHAGKLIPPHLCIMPPGDLAKVKSMSKISKSEFDELTKASEADNPSAPVPKHF